MAIAVAHQKRGSFLPAVCVVEGEFRRPRSDVKVGAHGGSFQLARIHAFPPPPLLRWIVIVGITGGPRVPSGDHLKNDQARRRRVGRDAERLQRVAGAQDRSEEHTSELQSLMRISYAVFCLKKK